MSNITSIVKDGIIILKEDHYEKIRERFIRCLLGGAIGDALGYPVEFFKLYEIYARYGENGIEDLAVVDGLVFFHDYDIIVNSKY